MTIAPEFYYPALATLFSIFVFFRLTIAVGNARRKYKVDPPKTAGSVHFERVFRVQQNTVEQYPLFLAVIICM
jgi:glutathione S-transferase